MGTPGTSTEQPEAVLEPAPDNGKPVAHGTAGATRQVAETVKGEASNVAGEVSTQVRSLVGRASEEVRDQVERQRSRAAGALRTTADELGSLAHKEHSQLTGELIRRAADRARRVADYVEQTRPAEVVEQVRGFARRRPAAFLVAAALAGVVVGRVVKGATSGAHPSAAAEPSSADMAPTTPTNYRSTGSPFAEPLPESMPVHQTLPAAGVGTATTAVGVAEPVLPDADDPGLAMPEPGTSRPRGTAPREDLR